MKCNCFFIPRLLFVMGILFLGSCKNDTSEKEIPENVNGSNKREFVSRESSDEEFHKFLDSIENYILTDYLTERDLRSISKDQRKFQVARIDLNSDGKPETLVNFVTPYFCGSGGCSMVLLDDNLQPITTFTGISPPVFVEPAVQKGWKTLIVHAAGNWRRLSYFNGSYPTNPSMVEPTASPPSKDATALFDSGKKAIATYTF